MPANFNPNNDFEPDEDPLENDDELWDLLSLYADGEATPEQAVQVESLLRSDPTYARDFEFLKMTSKSVESYVEIEPPASLRDAIFAATTRKQTLASRLAFAWADFRRAFSPRYAVTGVGFGLAAIALMIALWPHVPVNTVVPPASTPPAKIALEEEPATIASPMQLVHINAPTAPRLRIHMPSLEASEAKTRVTSAVTPKKSDKNLIPRPTPIASPSSSGAGEYAVAYRPGMDSQNQKPQGAMLITSEPIEGVTVTTADPAPPTKIKEGPPPGPKIMVAHLPDLPPDSSQVLSSADFKRQDEALSDGYDRSVVRNIAKKEVGLPLYKGKF